MARDSRSQRRARREAQLASNGAAAPRAQRRQQGGAAALPARAPVKTPSEPRSIPGSGAKRFVSESWGELKKVEWPNQNQVVQATTVVLIACVIVGAFLYLNDVVWQHVVQNWLLK
jgi:preprotein translocase SecE subunit